MKYIKHIILTAMAMLLTAGQVWALTLKIDAPNGQTMSREVEPTESIETIKTYVESWSNGLYDYRYLHLFSGDVELANDKDLYYYGFTSGTVTLTMTYDYIPARQSDGTWQFTMPYANQLLEVEYEPWTLTLSHNAGHGTVELLRPGSSATVGNAENAFQYCYDCQRSPAYPTVANNGNNYLSGFTNPNVGLNGVGVTNNPNGPWKLEYVGKYSHSEYNFSVSGVRHTYGLNSDEDVPIFLLYQWSNTTNQYEPVVYGVACAYSKLNNTHGDDHTLLFVAEGHWGCFLSNNQHSQNLNISFDEDLSTGMHDFAVAATPSLPDGVVDNGNGTYSVTPGTEVTIEAIANTAEHYYFDNWTNEADEVYSGSGVVTPSGAKPATSLLTFTVTGDTTVRGNFKIDTYTLRVKPNSISMGHVGIGETVYTSEYKDTVMTDRQHIDVTAIPEPGHYFVNWTNIHGDTVSTSVTLNYQATSDTTFTANFAAYATLQVASNNTAWGTVGEPQVGAGNTDHKMTLYDESESTSNHMVPAFTCWFDALTKSQYIIPASKMADAKGGTISSIQYYTQDPVSWTSGAVDVYLKEVTYSTLSSIEDKGTCTVVYTGQLTFENGGVTITFTNPYTYNGGNLLVGLENTSAGQYYCGIQFLGEDAPGASMSGHSGNFQQQDFLPQCTFTYQPSGVKVNPNGGYYIIPGNEVTVTATPETDYHLVNWTDENSNVMGTDVQLTLTITGDTTAMANFQSNSATTYTLTLATNDNTMGTVTLVGTPAGVTDNNDGTYTVIDGTQVTVSATVTATPAENFHLVNWTDENSNVMGTDAQITLTITGDTTVQGNFGRDFEGTGTEDDPYLIPSIEKWNLMATRVGAGNSYEGKYFRQTADINQTNLHRVGTGDHPFCGTYDGQGHSIRISSDWPFYYVNGATIKNLHIKGNNYRSQFASGLIYRLNQSDKTTNIINCRSSIEIRSTYQQDIDGTHGGFVGVTRASINFIGCVFDGKFVGQYGPYCRSNGGFIGWTDTSASVHFKDCIFAPEIVSMGDSLSCTFSRARKDTSLHFTNCYYTQAYGTEQGKQMDSITAGEFVTSLDFAGVDTVYTVSGITAYANNMGLKYGDILYAGNGDVVELSLSHADRTADGFSFNTYSASNGGIINGTTLTMPDTSTVISANYNSTTPTTPGLTPEGEVTVLGNKFVDEHGQIVGSPRITEHGEFIDYGNSPQPVHLIGKFSVSSTQKVYFSPANLQYTRTSTSVDWSTGTWSFLAHQYSSVETAANPYCTENYGDKTAVGLFGWGTWGEGKTPNLTSTSNVNYTWSTDFSGALGGYSDWRTLTKDEWTYLLNTRATGVTVNSTNNARYTLATINTGTSMVKGMIIFPDGFTGNNTEGVSWGTINAASNYTTTCTTAGWNALESANCLFLPATGWRAINETINDCTRVEGINSWGYYWTNNASNNSTLNAYVLKFDSQYVEPDELAIRRLGFSVRLVRNAE